MPDTPEGPWPTDRMRRWVAEAKVEALVSPQPRWAASYAADVELLLGFLDEYRALARAAAER